MLRWLLIILFIVSNSSLTFSQKLSIEDLISLNSKTSTQLAGIFQKYRWTEHRGLMYFRENRTESIFSKKLDENPLSLEIIKYSALLTLHDSYIELITLDSVRQQELKTELKNKYKVTHEILNLNTDTLDVYTHSQHVFIFKRKISGTPPLSRYHIYIYNTTTYKTLQRKQEYNDFWQD